jgi:PPK2 family polyphosphate:nucleotide phosphotransferase
LKHHHGDFRVHEGHEVDLEDWPTRAKPLLGSKGASRKALAEQVERLSALQRLLYASNQHALLVIFQAMDAAGKDGAISHVMSGVNPQGCQVNSFKHPSADELEHDFLWRTTRCLPARGQIGIFNRSYYEEVLIARVHPEILQGEGLPDEHGKDEDGKKGSKKARKHPKQSAHPPGDDIWESRFKSIRNLESHLGRNGTRIVKLFLHLSKDEQRRRFLDRIDDPDKRWKFSQADIAERGYWKDYMKAYQACLGATSTTAAPWYVVPADDKENARLLVSQIIVGTLEKLEMKYPVLSEAKLRELRAIHKLLVK